MAKVTSLSELVGRTPLLEARRYAAARGLHATLYVKLESANPAGSAKDRVALWAAEQLARMPENAGKHIVALLPDTGERYLSTPLFREDN